ncbi:MAG: hypothetical protein RLZZ282_1539 [Verrucomicrobiota bacterium]
MLAGVLSRWPWIVAGTLLAATLGVLVGIRITHPSYSLAVSLIKRKVTQTVQTSEVGQAYRPVTLNDATLLATLLATEPLDLALKYAKNHIDPYKISSLVESKQLEGTDIFFITYHSPVSPQDAVAFTTIWAAEINAYTQRLQQTEAHEVRLILQKEVHDLEQQILANNLETLNFSKDKDYLGGDAQISAALTKLSNIELQLETARTTVAAKQQQLKTYTEQIQRQSPIESQLKTVKDELANLRATYTDANPLVQAKLQTIEYLNSQIAQSAAKGQLNFDAYTGTQLGNELYLAILTQNNELTAAKSQIQSLEESYAHTTKRLAEFPAIISAYETLKKKNASYAAGLVLMSNRLKEAEIFASSAPGYWQVFQSPDARRIIPSSLIKKPAIVGIGCAIFGGGLSTLLTLLLSHRSSRRSILECCAATQAPLVASIPTTNDTAAHAALESFWLTQLAPRLHSSPSILWWTPAIDPADERRFWSMLATIARDDTGSPMRICDLTPDHLWDENPCPESLAWSTHSSSSSPPYLLRASSLPHGQARDTLAHVDYWLTIVSGNKESLRRARESRSLSTAYLPPCNGTIACHHQPHGHIREAADVLSCFLAKHFS